MPRPTAAVLHLDDSLARAGFGQCRRCGVVKDVSSFGNYAKARHGKMTSCKQCVNSTNKSYVEKYVAADPEGYAARRRGNAAAYRQRRRETRGDELRSYERNQNLKRYGLTAHDFDVMLAEQDGRCVICMTPKPQSRWHVDHDHTTGEVRGILCNLCNVGLGTFQDDPERLRAAALYLRKSSTPAPVPLSSRSRGGNPVQPDKET